MSTEKNLSIATEAIHFQGDGFFKDLLADLATFPTDQRAAASNAEWENLEKRLSKTVLDRTGLIINFDLAVGATGSIFFTRLDWSHIFNSYDFVAIDNNDEIIKSINAFKKELSVSLDLKKCVATGSISKTIHGELSMSREMLYKEAFGAKFTDEEYCSLLLHEIGHFWTSLEFLDRSVSTNQVLAELQRDLLNVKEPSKRATIIRTAGKDLGIDRNVVQSIENAEDMVVSTVLLSNGMKAIRTQSGHSFYDMNTFEMLADQYAARHGAGAHLFSALNKLMKWNPDYSMQDRATLYYTQAARFVGGLVATVLGGGLVATGAPFMVIIGIVAAILGVGLISKEDVSPFEPMYDSNHGRLVRLRNQQVQAIKVALARGNTKFNAAYVKQLNEELAFMDKVLKLGSSEPTLVSKVFAFFNANAANRQANVTFQRQLEGLAHNDLYAKAAALKSI